jgi:hypothetical protein
MAASSDSTEFESLRAALAAWVGSKDRPEDWREVENVAAFVAERLGEIVKVHIPPEEGYIGLTFATMPKKIGAFVSVKHIEHIIELEGSFPSETSKGYWRTQLKSASISKTPVHESKMDSFVCPEHNMLITKYAKCPYCE